MEVDFSLVMRRTPRNNFACDIRQYQSAGHSAADTESIRFGSAPIGQTIQVMGWAPFVPPSRTRVLVTRGPNCSYSPVQ